jgi:hypothetical protein
MAEISEELLREVRIYVFRQSADTGQVPQPPEIAQGTGHGVKEITAALKQLALNKVLILAPNDTSIWAANPFCAVPSGFRVRSAGKIYWAICIWDALGIPVVLHENAIIDACCGDCGDPMQLEVAGDKLARAEGIIHFAVPAYHWWDNIGFT